MKSEKKRSQKTPKHTKQKFHSFIPNFTPSPGTVTECQLNSAGDITSCAVPTISWPALAG